MLFWSFSDFDLIIWIFQLLKGAVTKNVIFRPKSQFFRYFSWNVDARVLFIVVMQKFGEKSVYFG